MLLLSASLFIYVWQIHPARKFRNAPNIPMATNRLKAKTFPCWKMVCLWIEGDTSVVVMPPGVGKDIKNSIMCQCWKLLILVSGPW